MADIQTKIFMDLLQKLSLPKNDKIIRKSIEVLNLIQAKSNNFPVNENVKHLLCLDISSELNHSCFADISEVVKIAGIRKTAYSKNKKIMLKLLNLDKKITIDEILKKLKLKGNKVIEKSAKEIYEKYQNERGYDENQEHPSVYSMSVFCAAKSCKFKIPRKEILSLSTLTQKNFSIMEKSWEKFIKTKESENKTHKSPETDPVEISKSEVFNKKRQHEEIFCYEEWKQRMLDKAYDEIKRLKKEE